MAGRKAVGLDIGTTSVRAAQLSWDKDQPKLERFGQVALPHGVVRDGEVIDAQAVADAVKELWRRAKIGTKKVTLGVSNQKVIVRQVDLPWLPLAELRKSLAFQVADIIPIPVEQAVLDMHPLEEVTLEDGSRRQRVLLVAASREMVNASLDVVRLAGLSPAAVDLNSFALLRAAGGHESAGLENTAEALVDVGASVTNVVVHQNGIPRFVRILLMGGADITGEVADRMGVPFDQAENIKQTSVVPADPSLAGANPITRVLEAAATTWVEEVRGSLDYYLSQPGAARLRSVVLSGGGGLLQGLGHRLALTTRVPVEPAHTLTRLQLGRTRLTPQQLAYVEPLAAVSVGLAMGAVA